MRTTYYVTRRTEGGNWKRNEVFTNKRKAMSFAFNWVRDQKYIHRSKHGENDRDYSELQAVVYGIHETCDSHDFFVAEYV